MASNVTHYAMVKSRPHELFFVCDDDDAIFRKCRVRQRAVKIAFVARLAQVTRSLYFVA